MDPFIQYLQAISPLRDSTQKDLAQVLKKIELPKNHILLKQGQVCHYLYFVEEGLLRLYYYRDGKDITDYFAPEQNIIGGIDSFFSKKPSEKIIETLEPCKLTAISYTDLEHLYQQHHDLERLGRILSIQAFLSMQERLFALQFHSATQRYQDLLKANPRILQRANLGHIASFLGVTQVTLSRIRTPK